MEFQIYDWRELDHDFYTKEDKITQYKIQIFGRDQSGNSVYIRLRGFKPYFYLLIPENTNSFLFIQYIRNEIKKKCYGYCTNIETDIVESKKAEGFDNNKMNDFVRYQFTTLELFNRYKSIIENLSYIDKNTQISHRCKLYESNISPMIRCFHVRNIGGCSWISIDKVLCKNIKHEDESTCNYQYETNWENINPVKKEINAPIVICSFDIECYSKSGMFPKATNIDDKIIQIGFSYTKLGSNIPFRRYISCLKDTNPIGNEIQHKCFDNEKDLLINFMEEIKEYDCDIMTGYNTFFFDEKYINDRCSLLKINNQVGRGLSKLKDYFCEFKASILSSSALGENKIYIWDTPGRVHIDLMKDIQKTYTSFSSYSLDSVSSYFIKGSIEDYAIKGENDYGNKGENDYGNKGEDDYGNKGEDDYGNKGEDDYGNKGEDDYGNKDNNILLYTKEKINDIKIGDFIHVEAASGMFNKSFDDKYQVVNYTDNIIEISCTNIPSFKDQIKGIKVEDNCSKDKTKKFFWSQAKDDIGPKEIFACYLGTPEDRKIVAKYCIKDCDLVGLLIHKLEVITKNIEMANVCYIPLKWLFTRGQGVKVFSLCLKEYRENNYIFPNINNTIYECYKCNIEYVNKRKCLKCKSLTDPVISKESNYEGAIVLDPIPRIENEPICVKDYASLYPSSIIQLNISHETIVESGKYNNVKNVVYQSIEYEDKYHYESNIHTGINDKTYKKCTFATKNNELGVLPKILNNLLNERKMVKKELKKSNDSFKTSMLNAKQLALKVTANSLYGQLGSKFSPIKKVELAASTTAVGRKMIFFAKSFDEEKLSLIYNTLLYRPNNKQIIYNKMNKNLDLTSIIDFINKNKSFHIQPVVKYGDTDSIFSCYKIRNNITEIYLPEKAEKIKELYDFGLYLILPFLNKNDSEAVKDNYYKQFIINENGIVLRQYIGSDKRILFIRNFIEYSFLAIVRMLIDVIEQKYEINDCYEHIELKLSHYLDNEFTRFNLHICDIYKNRRKLLRDLFFSTIKSVIDNCDNNEVTISEVYLIANKVYNILTEKSIRCSINPNNIEINLKSITEITKKFFIDIFNKKWEYSAKNATMIDLINRLYKDIYFNYTKKNIEMINYLMKDLRRLDNLSYSVKKKLLINHNDISLNDNDNTDEHIITFIEKFNKKNGRVSMEDLIDTFIQKELCLSFNQTKKNHYSMIIDFINNSYLMIPSKINIIESYWKTETEINILFSNSLNNDISNYVEKAITFGFISSNIINQVLPFPQVCEYEKSYCPFIILSKKKYVGYKYEDDYNKYTLDYTGIVLSRRDTSPILKEICNGLILHLLKYSDKNLIKTFIINCLEDMFNDKYDIKYFTQTKALKSKDSYKNWERIPHISLADRVMKRDPGNEIQTGTRLQYAAIVTDIKKVKLQSEIIETIDYIKENKIKINYSFYLKNQIVNPLNQFLDLIDKKEFKDIFNKFIEKYSKSDNEKLLDNIKILADSINKALEKSNTIIKNISSIEKKMNLKKYKNILEP